MRPVQIADIEAAARVLLLLPQGDRLRMLKTMQSYARVADRYRKRTGKPHPGFGNGTLMSAAARFPAAPRPASCHRSYLHCLGLITFHLMITGDNHVP